MLARRVPSSPDDRTNHETWSRQPSARSVPSRRRPTPHRKAGVFSMRFSARSRFLLLASLAITVLAFAGSAAAANERSLAAPAPNDALSRALASGQITDAQYSLQRALAILAPRLADARYASAAAHASPREATMALRDLAARIGSLSSSERRLAMRLLARPTDGARRAPRATCGSRRRIASASARPDSAFTGSRADPSGPCSSTGT